MCVGVCMCVRVCEGDEVTRVWLLCVFFDSQMHGKKNLYHSMYIKVLYSTIASLITYAAFTSARPQQLSLTLVPPNQQSFVAPPPPLLPKNNAINPSVSRHDNYLTKAGSNRRYVCGWPIVTSVGCVYCVLY